MEPLLLAPSPQKRGESGVVRELVRSCVGWFMFGALARLAPLARSAWKVKGAHGC